MDRSYRGNVSDLPPSEVTLAKLIKQEQQLQSEIDVINTKLAYLSGTNKTVFDETEYKVYQTLKALDDTTLSLAEKTKLITGLLNQ